MLLLTGSTLYVDNSILLIHYPLPIDGQLNCFHFVAFMNNAAMNIHIRSQYRHMFLFLLCNYLGVQRLDHMIGGCLTI